MDKYYIFLNQFISEFLHQEGTARWCQMKDAMCYYQDGNDSRPENCAQGRREDADAIIVGITWVGSELLRFMPDSVSSRGGYNGFFSLIAVTHFWDYLCIFSLSDRGWCLPQVRAPDIAPKKVQKDLLPGKARSAMCTSCKQKGPKHRCSTSSNEKLFLLPNSDPARALEWGVGEAQHTYVHTYAEKKKVLCVCTFLGAEYRKLSIPLPQLRKGSPGAPSLEECWAARAVGD
ncbi:hypothetical protein CEXT_67181 [Caerostris extrusa]|uniref:Uncharacterized protein n=1 Tax=Caerostris extrusa TaxID=172846 RepID=A0AAV4Y1I7_CAEEX|nr:hypothetical protein CEXT_67181 [Caerostris extrusa]